MYKYSELINELELQIAEDTYREGDKLPSIRELSLRYGCSKSTVIRALQDLQDKHLIYAASKSGYYVMKRSGQRKDEGAHWIDFTVSAPDPDIFPYLDFQHCINKAIDMYRNDLFIYGTPQGLPSLIREMQRHLASYQVFANPDQIFITSGVQQALGVLTRIPFPNGRQRVLIEQPGYPLFMEYLKTYGIETEGIKRSDAGVDLNELERLFKTGQFKFFYTVPRFHNPLGVSYTRTQKKAIAQLAAKYDVYIVEDDYMADLEQDAKEDPIYAYDDAAHVIYLKSFSKIIFPGLRVGVAVLPEVLCDSFNRFKRLMDIDSSMLSQAALELYLKSGMFERHRKKMRSCYEKRSTLLHESIMRELDTATAQHYSYHPTGQLGVHTYLKLGDSVKTEQMIKRLQKKFIRIEMADSGYLPSFNKEKILKLNVSSVKEPDIRSGIEQVMQEIR
ncbi:aminotransferase-like domain-containing protein [Paenibacillus odorifer]|uniref:aminotransferase-like domain-containing protein n=1 Tax=Paenibacillus odorifer TaxID=189426 RepID=UPI002DBCBD1F|nr:PLP-dependent aminotransferase family protein [Paenibacillus odorifer]MEC0131219.1 PLP-dependent aminotransferase family protein [Paenibacillus odorifer]MEC0221780.1 PLP-dependent aminotransferase family protein [Paenibacillus odorifer]